MRFQHTFQNAYFFMVIHDVRWHSFVAARHHKTNTTQTLQQQLVCPINFYDVSPDQNEKHNGDNGKATMPGWLFNENPFSNKYI